MVQLGHERLKTKQTCGLRSRVSFRVDFEIPQENPNGGIVEYAKQVFRKIGEGYDVIICRCGTILK